MLAKRRSAAPGSRLANQYTADLVECSVVRQALSDSGLSVSQVARNLGWFRTTPDFQKVSRKLGRTAHNRSYPPQTMMGYETAVSFIRAMGLDPVDYDL